MENKRCPVCQLVFDESKSVEEQETHVNTCLDKDITKTDELLAKSLHEADTSDKPETRSEFLFCSFCTKNLINLSVVQRQLHMNRCADQFEKVYGQTKKKKLKNTNNLKKIIAGSLTCKYCQKKFTGEKLVIHMKRCAKKNNISTVQLLQDLRLYPLQRVGNSSSHISRGAKKNFVAMETEQTSIIKGMNKDVLFARALAPLHPRCENNILETKEKEDKKLIPSSIAERGFGETFKISRDNRLWNMHAFDQTTNDEKFILEDLHDGIKVTSRKHHVFEESFTVTQYDKLNILMDLNNSNMIGSHGFIEESPVDDISKESCEHFVNDISKLLDSSYHADIKIQCDDDTVLSAHRIILYVRAEKMLDLTKENHLDLSTFSPLSVHALLKYLYSGKLDDDVSTLDEYVVKQLFQLAQKFDIHLLLKLCESRFPSEHIEELSSLECDNNIEDVVDVFWKSTQKLDCFKDESHHDGKEIFQKNIVDDDDDDSNDVQLSDKEIDIMRDIFVSQVQEKSLKNFETNTSNNESESENEDLTEQESVNEPINEEENSNEHIRNDDSINKPISKANQINNPISKEILENDDYIVDYVCGSPEMIDDRTEQDSLMEHDYDIEGEIHDNKEHICTLENQFTSSVHSNDDIPINTMNTRRTNNKKDVSVLMDSALLREFDCFDENEIDDVITASPPICTQTSKENNEDDMNTDAILVMDTPLPGVFNTPLPDVFDIPSSDTTIGCNGEDNMNCTINAELYEHNSAIVCFNKENSNDDSVKHLTFESPSLHIANKKTSGISTAESPEHSCQSDIDITVRKRPFIDMSLSNNNEKTKLSSMSCSQQKIRSPLLDTTVISSRSNRNKISRQKNNSSPEFLSTRDEKRLKKLHADHKLSTSQKQRKSNEKRKKATTASRSSAEEFKSLVRNAASKRTCDHQTFTNDDDDECISSEQDNTCESLSRQQDITITKSLSDEKDVTIGAINNSSHFNTSQLSPEKLDISNEIPVTNQEAQQDHVTSSYINKSPLISGEQCDKSVEIFTSKENTDHLSLEGSYVISSPCNVSYDDCENYNYNSFLCGTIPDVNEQRSNDSVLKSSHQTVNSPDKISSTSKFSHISEESKTNSNQSDHSHIENSRYSSKRKLADTHSPSVDTSITESFHLTHDCSVILEDLNDTINVETNPKKKRVSFAETSKENDTTHVRKREKMVNNRSEKAGQSTFGPGSSIHPETQQPITPMPNYAEMNTPKLKVEIKKYALRDNIPKKKMVKKMEEIFKYKHNFTDWEATEAPTVNKRTKKTKVKAKTDEVDSSPAKKNEKTNISEQLFNIIQSDDVLYNKVLLYEPLEFNEFLDKAKKADIKCTKKQLQIFFDQRCICTYDGTSKQPRTTKRRGKRKK